MTKSTTNSTTDPFYFGSFLNGTAFPWTFDTSLCTPSICSIDLYGQLRYIPSLAGNALYLAIFSIFLAAQLYLGIRHRTWGYLVAMAGGIILEIAGYIGRILLHNNDFDFNNFIIYIVCLTIGPAFLSAAIYLVMARVIAVYGTELSWLKPRTITVVFIGCDFVSLVLQAAGGAIASTSNDQAGTDSGVNIMIAGLSTQVVSIFVFMCICTQMMWNVRKHAHKINQNSATLRQSLRFRIFLWATGIATLAILIRCCFRVAELSGGFGGSLANNQASFMILEGAMIIIAVFCLTIGHPGPVLGSMWTAGGFHLRGGKNRAGPGGEGGIGGHMHIEGPMDEIPMRSK